MKTPSLPMPPAPPVVSGSSQVSGVIFVINTLTGLEPGRRLEQTFSFTPDGSEFARFYGGTAAEADAEGNIFAFDQLGWLSHGERGVLRGWWREPGTEVFAEPIELADGRAEIAMTVP